jgi:Zn-dependent protease
MRLSWNLGRVAGIDLYLHPSALLLFVMVAGSGLGGLASAALTIALLTSIVLHELGHALMARRYGIPTEDITLYLFGGVARLQRMPRSSGPELLIALAGPAVNFAIVLALWPVIALASSLGAPLVGLLQIVSNLNLGLGLFNLLPVFPMDGGRVFRALLSGWLGRLRGTEVAATVGQAVAVVAGVVGIGLGMWQLAILAAFVYFAGGNELAQVSAESQPDGGFRHVSQIPEPPPGYRWVARPGGKWGLIPLYVQPNPRTRSWS